MFEKIASKIIVGSMAIYVMAGTAVMTAEAYEFLKQRGFIERLKLKVGKIKIIKKGEEV